MSDDMPFARSLVYWRKEQDDLIAIQQSRVDAAERIERCTAEIERVNRSGLGWQETRPRTDLLREEISELRTELLRTKDSPKPHEPGTIRPTHEVFRQNLESKKAEVIQVFFNQYDYYEENLDRLEQVLEMAILQATDLRAIPDEHHTAATLTLAGYLETDGIHEARKSLMEYVNRTAKETQRKLQQILVPMESGEPAPVKCTVRNCTLKAPIKQLRDGVFYYTRFNVAMFSGINFFCDYHLRNAARVQYRL